MAKKTGRQESTQQVAKEERDRQKEKYHQDALKRDRIRRNIGLHPIQQYLPVNDDPKEDLGCVEPIETSAIIPP